MSTRGRGLAEDNRVRDRSRSRRRRRRSNRDHPPDENEKGRGTSIPVLGRTSGLAAVGAWAARYEIANLLAAGCHPTDLIRVIHKGEEGREDILYEGTLLKLPPAESRGSRSDRGSTVESRQRAADGGRKEPLIETEDDDKVSESASVKWPKTEAEVPEAQAVPPWAKREKANPPNPPSRHSGEVGDSSLKFAKPANPPPIKTPETEVKVDLTSVKVERTAEEIESFSKRAKPPSSPGKVRSPGRLEVVTLGKGREKPKTIGDRETQDLKRYHEKSLEIFRTLRIMGITMDLMDLVIGADGKVKEERFSLHTAPNRASTGFRYARLMENLLSWGGQDERPVKEDVTPFDRLCTLEFIEHLMQKGCGSNTPRSVLLALDYYGKAFGFESQKGHFGRAKRLSLRCAENPIRGRVGAPLFSNEFISALEGIVSDPFLHLPQRIAAGKLRLCIQSSTRFDDILNTPLSQCEWVRKKGELSIIALRSKALRGKNRARAWIASTLGVTPSGDGWLPTLMDLLLKAHKSSWKTDDHIGKLASRDGRFFHDSPAKMDADVTALKNVLLENLGQSGYAGISEGEVSTMRWHGAKATLTTVMQHINISPRAVRFAGDWSASGEGMADLYLREAQLLTLDAQQKALRYLRLGGGVVGLVGEPVFKEPKDEEGKRCSFETVVEAMEKMELPEVAVHEAPQELYDQCFENGLPDMDLIEAETQQKVDPERLESWLEEIKEDVEEEAIDVDGHRQEKVAVEVENPLAAEEAVADSASTSDEEFDEAMVEAFVMVTRPTAASKLHLKLAASKAEALGSARPVPRCGARGTYDSIRADEHVSAGLCSRCFGKGGCDHLCSWTQVDDQGTGKLRCSRRCSLEGSDHAQHLSAFHT